MSEQTSFRHVAMTSAGHTVNISTVDRFEQLTLLACLRLDVCCSTAHCRAYPKKFFSVLYKGGGRGSRRNSNLYGFWPGETGVPLGAVLNAANVLSVYIYSKFSVIFLNKYEFV